MTQNIEGKIVVITGASSGLGEATARHLAAASAKLVLGTAGASPGAAFRRRSRDADRRYQPRPVKALIDHAVATRERVEVILNNAGLMPHSPLERRKIDPWDRADPRR